MRGLDRDEIAQITVVVGLVLIVALPVVSGSTPTEPRVDVETSGQFADRCEVSVTGSLGDGDRAADRVVVEGLGYGTISISEDDVYQDDVDIDRDAQRGSLIEVYAVTFDEQRDGSVEMLSSGRLTDSCSYDEREVER